MSRLTILHLSLVSGIGPATVEKLIGSWPAELDDLYLALPRDINKHTGLHLTVCENIVKGLANRAALEAELELIARHAINFVTLCDEKYPSILKSIHLPPAILYWKGKHPNSFIRSIAFVGSRKANNYAARTAKMIVGPLADLGFCIVSGGALGADTLAHKIALEHKASTVAIIGSGLLHPYPAQNSSLFEKIIENNGTLLSSFPVGMQGLPGNFPARNRIIAGMSQACVVLQAAERSGALITAQFALESSRELGAVPGPIDDELSAGCHKLIAQGAHIITSAQDVLHLLGLITHPLLVTPIIQNHQSKKPLNDDETVLYLCSKPISFDDLIEKTAFEAGYLHEKLFTLQVAGKVQQDFSGLWHTIF